MGYRIQNRRDTAARWAEMNPILLEGEIGLVTDNANQYKIGDGIHAWNDLPLRGFTGTISQELGEDENAVVSQKVVTEKFVEADGKLAELGSEVNASYSATNSIIENLISTSNPQFELASFEQISNKFLDEQGDVQDIDNSAYTIQKISVAEGDIYKIKGVTSPSHLCTWALYNGGNKVFYQSASGKVLHIVIPKGVDTLYVQNVNSIDEQYKMIKWDIAFESLIYAINTTMVGVSALAKLFAINTTSIDIERLERKFFNTKGEMEDIANDSYAIISAKVSEGDMLFVEAVVSPPTQPKYAFYKGGEIKFFYIDSVYQNTYVVVVPNGVDTIYVQTLNNVGSVSKVTLSNDASAILETKIKDVSDRVSQFEIGEITEIDVTNSCTIESNTYIDISAVKGKYNGVSLYSLQVSEGEEYYIKNAFSWLSFRAFLVANEQGNIIYYQPNNEDNPAVYREDFIIIPKDGVTLYIHHNDDSLKETSIKKITRSPFPSRSLSLKGKKWVCIGDSLTESNLRATKNYHDYVADATGIEVINMGRSGTGYKRTEDEGFAFYQRVENIPIDADVITIFGSGNDNPFYGSALGTASDSGTDTLGGCINTTIDRIITKMPLAVIGIVSPTPWVGYSPSDKTNGMSIYSELLKEICYKRGIPFLDLFHCSGLRPDDATFRELAYSRDEGNGVHPDENGHKLIAPRFKAFLETLVL